MSETNVPPVCSRCNKYIYDGTLVQVADQYLHSQCVQCVVCRVSITGSCHLKDDQYYCRTDFIKLHGAKCDGCDDVISPSEGVHDINGRLYHTTCFSCSACAQQLHTGDLVYLKEDGKLLCPRDYLLINSSDNADHESDSESDESGSDDTDVRHQTTVNDTQLRMLNEAYSDNKRPSKKERTQLSKSTHLNDRTIQMWFHNKRAKDKSLTNQSNVSISKRRHTIDYRPANWTEENNCKKPCWSDIKLGKSKGQGRESDFGGNSSFPSANETHVLDSDNLSSSFQLYCPLDYLLPNEMPPNVDLSSADICNGEVIPGKHNTNTNYLSSSQPPAYLNQWLSI